MASDSSPADVPPGRVHCSFDCTRSAAQWHVRDATVREGLARPYRALLSLVTLSLDADPDELVGSSCDFTFDNATCVRPFRGVVTRAHAHGHQVLRGDVEVLAVDIEVAPALATLGQRINCRIFQDMTVPEILRDVLLGAQAPTGAPPEGLTAYARTIDDSSLQSADYDPPRDYCVQYRESDLDFVTRLMHEEGIVFVFDQHTGDHEVVKLLDREGSLPELESPAGLCLPVDAEAARHRDAIKQLTVERAATAPRVHVQHHDWLLPLVEVQHPGMAVTLGEVASNDREVFVPSERRPREVYVGPQVTAVHDDSKRRLEIALQRLMRDDFVGRGKANACGLGAGAVFEIDHGHAFERMVALEVVHEIHADANALDAWGSYENTFVCVPASRYRAASVEVPRPVIHGPQTATVTGPPGEDIHTDRFGRIKLLMHWDREGEGRGRALRRDASSSVWVPVVQTWAGAGWGSVFLPRTGMEVLVEFVNGNPDRPVVVGCLYNGLHPPPYALPEERTKSTIRTKSTPATGGFNELRFEDAAEHEEVYLRAQRDYNERVLRNHGTEVGVDQTHDVGHDRTRRVGGDEQVTVEGSRVITVQGEDSEGFSGQRVKVTQDYELDVAKTILVKAPVQIRIECEGSFIEMTPGRIELHAGDGAKVVLDANALVESNDGSRALLDDNVEVQASTGGEIRLDGDARMTSKDAAEVKLTADAKIRSGGDAYGLFEAETVTTDSGKATVTLTQADIALDGDSISAAADTKLGLEGGGARTTLQGGRVGAN